MRRTFKSIAAEYGMVALAIYLLIFAVVLGSFWFAISAGWNSRTVTGEAGMMGNVGAFTAAYLATKVTQPIRIGATLLVTPLVARVLERFFPRMKAEPRQPGA